MESLRQPNGLSILFQASVWWLRLGIVIECIKPAISAEWTARAGASAPEESD
jgi:hypothetical protein